MKNIISNAYSFGGGDYFFKNTLFWQQKKCAHFLKCTHSEICHTENRIFPLSNFLKVIKVKFGETFKFYTFMIDKTTVFWTLEY